MEEGSRRNQKESWRKNIGGIVEDYGQPWRMCHGGVIIEEAAGRRRPGEGSQKEATRRQPGGTRRYPRGAIRHPESSLGGTTWHPGGSQEAPESVSVSVTASE